MTRCGMIIFQCLTIKHECQQSTRAIDSVMRVHEHWIFCIYKEVVKTVTRNTLRDRDITEMVRMIQEAPIVFDNVHNKLVERIGDTPVVNRIYFSEPFMRREIRSNSTLHNHILCAIVPELEDFIDLTNNFPSDYVRQEGGVMDDGRALPLAILSM